MPPGVALSDFYYILPELVLTVGALAVLVVDVLLPRGSKALSWVALLVLAATIASALRSAVPAASPHRSRSGADRGRHRTDVGCRMSAHLLSKKVCVRVRKPFWMPPKRKL